MIHTSPSGTPWLYDGFEISKKNGIMAANGSFKNLGSLAVRITYDDEVPRMGFFGTTPIAKKSYNESGIIDPKLAELAIILRGYGLFDITN